MDYKDHDASVLLLVTGLPAQRPHPGRPVGVLHPEAPDQHPPRGAGRLQLLLHLRQEEEAAGELRADGGTRHGSDDR